MHIAISGQPGFISRHYQLIRSLQEHATVATLPCGGISTNPAIDALTRAVMNRGVKKFSFRRSEAFWKSPATFEKRSRTAEALRRKMHPQPDYVLHLMGLFSPVWEDKVPYGIYTDLTMAQARQKWLDWIPFGSEREYEAWIEQERRLYHNAQHVFTMITSAAHSVIHDYGVPPERVTAIGAGGRLQQPWTGARTYGSRMVLFNGSRWRIKGGDRMLDAFPLVRKRIPDARLVMIGCKPENLPDGVEALGNVSNAEEMKRLFQTADLLAAPARIEALGTIGIEAMEYGTPSLVAEGTGMTDYILHDETGWVQRDFSPQALADSIIHLLSDPARLQCYGEACRKVVNERYNWPRVARDMMATIQGQAAPKPAYRPELILAEAS